MAGDGLSREDQALLQALIVGDKKESDADVQARLRDNPEFSGRWLEMAGTLEDVALLGQHLRDQADEGASPSIDAGAAIQRFRAEQDRSRSIGRLRWFALAVAAAALALVAILVDWRAPSRDVDPLMGGDATIRLLPDGRSLERGSAFEWDAGKSFDSYELQVRDVASDESSATPEVLFETRWLPTDPEYDRLPESFRWRVLCMDAAGEVVARSRWARSSRQ